MPTVILLIFVIAFLILFLGKYIRSDYYRFIGFLPAALFITFLAHIPIVHWDRQLTYTFEWIPTLGIDMNFRIDGLSMLFALLITGIGTLVYFYASNYLKNHIYLNRFYCYLTLFMGAMLGLVLSDNMISVFIFWELTSISSFFLIGFNNEEEGSRKSALTALGITGLGGFFLLGAFVFIGNITGTYSISELFSSSEALQNHSLFPLILFLIFGGAFTKSAQFPFHFWLPGAMQAPTPVSAYLHSATMVKAGIYILARFSPIMQDGFWWNNTLMITGGVTMLYGAFHSIFRVDMKAVLAYSTISALGIIVFLLGLGTEYALLAAVTFILVHALYKATLFLATGIVDHAVHTRNLTELSGLRKIMPLVFWACLIAALSSAGVPLLFGFISKDLIYEATLDFPKWGMWLTGAAVLTNIFLACSGFMAGIKPFVGKLPEKFEKAHKPSAFLWIPVVILSFLTLLFGLFPGLLNDFLWFAFRETGGKAPLVELKIWHGFNLVLLLSGVTIFLGAVIYLTKKFKGQAQHFIMSFEGISPKHLTEIFGERTREFAFRYTRFFQNGYLRNYILTIIVFITVLVGYRLFSTVPLRVNTEELSDFRLYELIVFVAIVIGIIYTVRTPSRLTAIASLGIIGYGICLIFVFYGAPDLAMTQFTIDTLIVVLFVLVLFKLPPFLSYRNRRTVVRDAVVSGCFGILIAIITLQALVAPSDKEVSKFYAENAYTLAKGKNVVNVILVDFRGFDTMIETIVLSIAALGVFGLLKYRMKNEERED
ncbi:MAG: hydrogen gas-evolving membrane-bound hydrogenase subunit E [Flavobacteriaceae bacterium]